LDKEKFRVNCKKSRKYIELKTLKTYACKKATKISKRKIIKANKKGKIVINSKKKENKKPIKKFKK
jgi:hypothetical protein